MSAGWRDAARTAGIEPALVEEIALRYRQHAEHTLRGGGRPLPVAQWFRFYQMENAATLSADKVVVEGCSVDERAVPPPSEARVRDIFGILDRYIREKQTAGD